MRVLVSKSHSIQAGSVVHAAAPNVPFHIPAYVMRPVLMSTVALLGIRTLMPRMR